jgi:hypothetical protein
MDPPRAVARLTYDTIYRPPGEVAAWERRCRLRGLARQQRISLNKAALLLLRRGAGLDPERRGEGAVGSTLDEFFGGWSDDEARDFLAGQAVFEQIDEDMWR